MPWRHDRDLDNRKDEAMKGVPWEKSSELQLAPEVFGREYGGEIDQGNSTAYRTPLV